MKRGKIKSQMFKKFWELVVNNKPQVLAYAALTGVIVALIVAYVLAPYLATMLLWGLAGMALFAGSIATGRFLMSRVLDDESTSVNLNHCTHPTDKTTIHPLTADNKATRGTNFIKDGLNPRIKDDEVQNETLGI